MPRLAPIALACVLLLPRLAAGDSREQLAESYIASTFRAIVAVAQGASSDRDAMEALRGWLDQAVALDATACFVLGKNWPTNNAEMGLRFQQQFRELAVTALAVALRTHREIALDVQRSRNSNGDIVVYSQLTLSPGLRLPVAFVVHPEGAKGRRRIANIVVDGIDAQVVLREMVATALADNGGNVEAAITLFHHAAARIDAYRATVGQPDDSQTVQ